MKIWVGDYRRVIRDCLYAYDGPIQLGAVTRPGADVLPWDGKQVLPDVARKSNLAFQADFGHLHAAAAARTRRKFGVLSYLARVFEPQKRGVYHAHPIVGVKTPRERAAASYYWQQLAELAPEYGFGFVERRPRTMEAAHAANYAAKYLSDANSSKLGIANVVMRDDCPPRPVWVNPNLQRRSGSSIRACRERRIVWRLTSHLAAMNPSDGCSTDEAREVRSKLAWHKRFSRRRSAAPRLDPSDEYNEQLALKQRQPVDLPQMYEDRSHLDRLIWAAERLFPGVGVENFCVQPD